MPVWTITITLPRQGLRRLRSDTVEPTGGGEDVMQLVGLQGVCRVVHEALLICSAAALITCIATVDPPASGWCSRAKHL